ncbi:hypothetical protein D3C81_1563960 [compost metagenome]
MPVAIVFKVIVNPRLRAQALEQLQIGLAILRAERPGRVAGRQIEAALGAGNPVLPEHLFDDLRHRTATEDALTEAQREATEFRPQTDPAQSRALCVFMLDKALQLPVHALPRRPETEERRTV